MTSLTSFLMLLMAIMMERSILMSLSKLWRKWLQTILLTFWDNKNSDIWPIQPFHRFCHNINHLFGEKWAMIPEYYIEVLHWGTNLVLLNLGIKLGTCYNFCHKVNFQLHFSCVSKVVNILVLDDDWNSFIRWDILKIGNERFIMDQELSIFANDGQ